MFADVTPLEKKRWREGKPHPLLKCERCGRNAGHDDHTKGRCPFSLRNRKGRK